MISKYSLSTQGVSGAARSAAPLTPWTLHLDFFGFQR